MAKTSKTTYEFGVVVIPRNPASGGDIYAVTFSMNTWTVLALQQTLGM